FWQKQTISIERETNQNLVTHSLGATLRPAGRGVSWTWFALKMLDNLLIGTPRPWGRSVAPKPQQTVSNNASPTDLTQARDIKSPGLFFRPHFVPISHQHRTNTRAIS